MCRLWLAIVGLGLVLLPGVTGPTDTVVGSTGRSETANLHLVKDGRPQAILVLPQEKNALTEQAAGFLAEYVEKITSAKLQTVREDDPQAAGPGPRVFLGATRAAQKATIDLSKVKDDGFVLKVVGGDLIVVGPDVLYASDRNINSFMARRGTLMGVFRLLEDCAGVGWFIPTPKGEWVPPSPNFRVPANLDLKVEPALRYAASGSTAGGFRIWANGYRRAINMKSGVHTWDAALRNYGDPAALFAKDRTMFALIDGQRNFRENGVMLCTSHPAFVEMNVKYLSKWFDEGYEWVGYGQSDGWRPCQCEKCVAVDNIAASWWQEVDRKYNWDWEVNAGVNVPVCERLWEPMYEIARQLYEKYPDRKVLMLAYNPTYPPPRKHPQFPPNVAVEMCRHTPKYLEAFASFKAKTVYTYWLGTYQVQGITPKGLPHEFAADIRRFAASGVLGLYICGGGEIWGLEGPAYYANGRMAWDPTRDIDQVLDTYYRGVYHAAAPAMKEFFSLLEERIVEGNKVQTLEERRVNQEKRRADLYFPRAYPPVVLEKLQGLLDKAKTLAKGDEMATGWLGLTELQFRYTKIIATGFNALHDQRANPTPGNAQRVAEAVAQRKAFLAELDGLKEKKEYLENWFPGWRFYAAEAPAGGAMFGRLTNQPPFGKK